MGVDLGSRLERNAVAERTTARARNRLAMVIARLLAAPSSVRKILHSACTGVLESPFRGCVKRYDDGISTVHVAVTGVENKPHHRVSLAQIVHAHKVRHLGASLQAYRDAPALCEFVANSGLRHVNGGCHFWRSTICLLPARSLRRDSCASRPDRGDKQQLSCRDPRGAICQPPAPSLKTG